MKSRRENEIGKKTAIVALWVYGILLTTIISLKLCGVITWSWWLVLSLLWIPIVMTAGIVVMCILIGILGYFL